MLLNAGQKLNHCAVFSHPYATASLSDSGKEIICYPLIFLLALFSCELLRLSSVFHYCLSHSILTLRRETPQLSTAVMRPCSSHLVFIIPWQPQPYFPVSYRLLVCVFLHHTLQQLLHSCYAWPWGVRDFPLRMGVWAGVFLCLFSSLSGIFCCSPHIWPIIQVTFLFLLQLNIIWHETWAGQSLPLHSRNFSAAFFSCCVSFCIVIPLQQKIWLCAIHANGCPLWKKKCMKMWAYEHVS